mgnify:CR=1 FL=1
MIANIEIFLNILNNKQDKVNKRYWLSTHEPIEINRPLVGEYLEINVGNNGIDCCVSKIYHTWDSEKKSFITSIRAYVDPSFPQKDNIEKIISNIGGEIGEPWILAKREY